MTATHIKLHSTWEATHASHSAHTAFDVFTADAHIVLLAFFRIRENGVGLTDIPEHLLSVSSILLALIVLVRVPLECQLAVGILDFLVSRLLLNSQNLVVILFLCFFGLLLCMFQFGLDTEASRIYFGGFSEILHCLVEHLESDADFTSLD